MSDDSGFYRKKKEEQRVSSSDIYDSLRKGPLAKENLEMLGNSSGLTPLNFCVDECNRILNRSHASDGLSTVRPFADARNMNNDPLNKELSQSTEIQRCLSGLCVPLGLSVEIQKRRKLNE
jgi:hypothetical protein